MRAVMLWRVRREKVTSLPAFASQNKNQTSPLNSTESAGSGNKGGGVSSTKSERWPTSTGVARSASEVTASAKSNSSGPDPKSAPSWSSSAATTSSRLVLPTSGRVPGGWVGEENVWRWWGV